MRSERSHDCSLLHFTPTKQMCFRLVICHCHVASSKNKSANNKTSLHSCFDMKSTWRRDTTSHQEPQLTASVGKKHSTGAWGWPGGPSPSVLTQLDVADPDALFALLQDLLKVDPSKAAGAARHQDGRHADKLGARRARLLLRGWFGGPLGGGREGRGGGVNG